MVREEKKVDDRLDYPISRAHMPAEVSDLPDSVWLERAFSPR